MRPGHVLFAYSVEVMVAGCESGMLLTESVSLVGAREAAGGGRGGKGLCKRIQCTGQYSACRIIPRWAARRPPGDTAVGNKSSQANEKQEKQKRRLERRSALGNRRCRAYFTATSIRIGVCRCGCLLQELRNAGGLLLAPTSIVARSLHAEMVRPCDMSFI